jgi:hypothetical protein
MAGFLNVVSLVSGASYTPGPPSDDDGNDGDYSLDLNTNTLYGPKDSSASTQWPTGPRLGGTLIWLGSWSSWVPGSFTTGQVVDDGSGQYYLCVKPHSVVVNSAGPWTAGQYYTYAGAQYYLCIQDTTVDPITLAGLSPSTVGQYWLGGTVPTALAADAAGTAGAARNWQALSSTITVDNTVGLGNPTRFIVKDASIGSTQLASNAVTTVKITDLNVTDAKLSSTGVTAGTYPKVTVTSKGRITAGATLDYTDLPTHGSQHGFFGTDPVSGVAYTQLSIGNATTGGTTPDNTAANKVVSAKTTTSGLNISSTNGAVDSTGVFAFKSTAANYTALTSDHVIYTATGGITVTLHSSLVATVPAGRILRIKNNAATAITVKTASGEYVNATNYSVTGYSLAAGGILNLCTTGSSSAAANNWITL